MHLRKIIMLVLVILGIAAVGTWMVAPSSLARLWQFLDRETLEALVARSGAWGPALIIGLMILAVVVSPLPSAPIALAAGAAYGHVWGTIQVIVGAEIGAMIAFALARILGRDVLKSLFGDSLDRGLLGSQNALTATVFASRLMPFVSFDLISYAAGLSSLQAWRFAVATLAGIIPASFVLAHLGGEAVSGDPLRATAAVIGLGLVTGLPLLWVAMRRAPKAEES
jgi:uncharacterized membrane protein YdjX (TVP38/TMEM64 family)